MTGTLLAIDGDNMLHRAYYAHQGSLTRAPQERTTLAISGFLRLLTKMIDQTDPAAVIVGFDDRRGSTRRARHPRYKASRDERDPELYTLLTETPELLTDLGITVMIPPALEADDVLASAATHAEQAGWRCVLATSDKDAFSLITERTTVYRPGQAGTTELVTPAALMQKYQVRPDQWRDYMILIGDHSDNLRGVHGIGPVTAVEILARFGTLDAALADPATVEAVIGKSCATKLTTDGALAAIARNRDLMTPEPTRPITPQQCRLTSTSEMVRQALRRRHLMALAGRVSDALCQRAVPQQHTTGHRRADKPPLECPMPQCGKPIRLVQLAAGGKRPIEADPTEDGTLGWVYTPAGWRMRTLNPDEQPQDPQRRRWTAHDCVGQWSMAA